MIRKTRMIRVRMIGVTEEQERQCIGHGHDRWWCSCGHWSKAYSFNRKKPGWSVVSEHIKKQAPLEVRQSWAKLGKVGQGWAKLGKIGRTEML